MKRYLIIINIYFRQFLKLFKQDGMCLYNCTKDKTN